jgi:hypothetical protein
MADPNDEEKPLDPAAERIVARVRWMSMLSGVATMLGIAVVIGVIGYRFLRSEGSVAPSEVVTMLPKGARVVSTAVATDRLVVTIEVGGSLEIRSFDLHSFKPAGRMTFAHEP